MKRITALLLFFSLTVHGQFKSDKRVMTESIYINAVENYLKYLANVDSKSVDTLFIEQIDTINFNLPKKIEETVIVVLPLSIVVIRLKDKTDPSFLHLLFWTDNFSKSEIIAVQRTCVYSGFVTEIINESENYRMSYIKKQTDIWKFKKTEKGGSGCRRFYKYENGQLRLYKSVCS